MIDKLSGFKESFFTDPKTRVIAALLPLLVALVVGSFSPILIRLSENEISPTATIFNRLWINTLIFGLWIGLNARRHQLDDRQQNPYTRKIVWLLLVSGFFSCVQQLIWALSLTQTSVANSSLMHSMTPLFVTLGGWILFAKSYDRKFLIGLAVSIGGMLSLGFGDFSHSITKVQGDLAALLAAMFYGVALLAIEQLRDRLDTPIIVFWSCLCGSILTLPILLIAKDTIFPHSNAGWAAVIGLGLNRTLVYALLVYVLNRLASGLVAMVMLLDPVFAALGGFAFFSETPGLSDAIAFVAVLLGIYLSISSESAVKNL